MNVGDKVSVLDDGKHSRSKVGEVVCVIDENTLVVKHTLWGYGDQLPMNHLYRYNTIYSGWWSVHDSYLNSEGVYVDLSALGYEMSKLVVREKEMKTVYDHVPHVTFEDGSRIYYPETKLETLKFNQISWTVSRVMREFNLYHNGALKLIGYAQEQGVLSKEEDYCGRFKVL